MIELTSLWKKTGPKGEYLMGNLGNSIVMVFKNTKKTAPNQPDYRVMITEKRKEETKPVQKQPQRQEIDTDGF